jgi:D-alanyl-D-alanine carboxypeptidase (penicillin-binding protein 5/6)
VVLGASNARARESQTRQLLDYGFRFFETSKIELKNRDIEIYKGDENTIKIGIKSGTHITLERGKFARLDKKLTINSPLIAPIKIGDKVGELTLNFEDKIIATLPIIAKQNIIEAGFFGRMIDSISLWF